MESLGVSGLEVEAPLIAPGSTAAPAKSVWGPDARCQQVDSEPCGYVHVLCLYVLVSVHKAHFWANIYTCRYVYSAEWPFVCSGAGVCVQFGCLSVCPQMLSGLLTGVAGPVALRQQERLDHLISGLRAGVDVLQCVRHRKLPVPQTVPVGQNVVVLKHLLVVAHRVVQFDQTPVVILQSTVAFPKQLLACMRNRGKLQIRGQTLDVCRQTPGGGGVWW